MQDNSVKVQSPQIKDSSKPTGDNDIFKPVKMKIVTGSAEIKKGKKDINQSTK